MSQKDMANQQTASNMASSRQYCFSATAKPPSPLSKLSRNFSQANTSPKPTLLSSQPCFYFILSWPDPQISARFDPQATLLRKRKTHRQTFVRLKVPTTWTTAYVCVSAQLESAAGKPMIPCFRFKPRQ